MNNYEVYRRVYLLAKERLSDDQLVNEYIKALHVLQRYKWSDEYYDNKTDVGT